MEGSPAGLFVPTATAGSKKISEGFCVANMRRQPQFKDHAECEILSSMAGPAIISRKLASKLRRHAPQSLVWTANDLHDRIFILESGRIHIGSIDADGRETLLRVVKAGEIFGEFCFCAHKDESIGTFARALTRSEVIGVSLEEFQRLLLRDQGLLAKLIETFCTRLAEAGQRTQILALHDARQRLGKLLLYLASRRGGAAEKHSEQVSVTVSHAELAALAALSRPHVSVLMAKLRRSGLISYGRTTPVTVNVKGLKESLETVER